MKQEQKERTDIRVESDEQSLKTSVSDGYYVSENSITKDAITIQFRKQ